MSVEGTCFVVQGFGKKTDFRTGRQLDLDASYEVIKEAVEDAGLSCVRADEIQHSQIIDKPMYELILRADLVIADLSTSNINAVYELGVRHALRKRPTIIVAEKEWDFPFDINRNLIRTYEHLGSDIGRKEARRFQKDLIKAIEAVMSDVEAVDSPLYTFLPDLAPPTQDDEVASFGAPLAGTRSVGGAAPLGQPEGASVKDLTDQAQAALDRSDFEAAKSLLTAVHEIRPNEDDIIQRLALATYKSKLPTEAEALRAARDLLQNKLDPTRSNDPETIGLWAAVHKRLWSQTATSKYLDTCIEALERGFLLRGDYYNGINLAFMLNERANLPDNEPAEAITDFMLARRTRQRVLDICQEILQADVEDDQQKYWLLASAWEASVGIGDDAAALDYKQQAIQHATAKQLPSWMVESTKEQIEKVQRLLSRSPLERIKPRDASEG